MNFKIVKVHKNQVVEYNGTKILSNKDGFQIEKATRRDPQIPEVYFSTTQTLRICKIWIEKI